MSRPDREMAIQMATERLGEEITDAYGGLIADVMLEFAAQEIEKYAGWSVPSDHAATLRSQKTRP